MAEKSGIELFGLSQKQIDILFSLERILTKLDIEENEKDSIYKKHWLERWSFLLHSDSNRKENFYFEDEDALLEAIRYESYEPGSSWNKTWFYLIMLEASLFQAYVPLGEKKDEDKHYQKLRYKSKTKYLKSIASKSGIMDEKYIDRFGKTYQKVYDKLSGKYTKMALGVVTVVAVGSLAAAAAGLFAGPIAVTLFGANFASLHGAALTSACLAFAGGGAISAGGAGMAGGVAFIVGGGALLGTASGGGAVGVVTYLAKNSPSFTLSQAAKLEVVLKEILINAQGDIQNAQQVMEKLKEQIHELQRELEELKLEQAKDKKACAQMKQSIEYLEKAYRDMMRFKSSYEIGLKNSQ